MTLTATLHHPWFAAVQPGCFTAQSLLCSQSSQHFPVLALATVLLALSGRSPTCGSPCFAVAQPAHPVQSFGACASPSRTYVRCHRGALLSWLRYRTGPNFHVWAFATILLTLWQSAVGATRSRL